MKTIRLQELKQLQLQEQELPLNSQLLKILQLTHQLSSLLNSHLLLIHSLQLLLTHSHQLQTKMLQPTLTTIITVEMAVAMQIWAVMETVEKVAPVCSENCN